MTSRQLRMQLAELVSHRELSSLLTHTLQPFHQHAHWPVCAFELVAGPEGASGA